MTLKPKDQEALEAARKALSLAEWASDRAAQQRAKAIRRAAQNGASLREIADVTGISFQMVHKIVGTK